MPMAMRITASPVATWRACCGFNNFGSDSLTSCLPFSSETNANFA
jgi:hypothetical protein